MQVEFIIRKKSYLKVRLGITTELKGFLTFVMESTQGTSGKSPSVSDSLPLLPTVPSESSCPSSSPRWGPSLTPEGGISSSRFCVNLEEALGRSDGSEWHVPQRPVLLAHAGHFDGTLASHQNPWPEKMENISTHPSITHI